MTNGTSSIPNLDARAGPLVLRTPRQAIALIHPAACRARHTTVPGRRAQLHPARMVGLEQCKSQLAVWFDGDVFVVDQTKFLDRRSPGPKVPAQNEPGPAPRVEETRHADPATRADRILYETR